NGNMEHGIGSSLFMLSDLAPTPTYALRSRPVVLIACVIAVHHSERLQETHMFKRKRKWLSL
ncbi:hypothetical protein BgiBS90_022302, partial [Biomphalaria glabrata]